MLYAQENIRILDNNRVIVCGVVYYRVENRWVPRNF